MTTNNTTTPRKKQNNTTQKERKRKKPEPVEHGILVDAAENIETGAKVVGNKVSEVASNIFEKTSAKAKPTYNKLKESLSDVSEFGKEMIEEWTNTAQHYVEKYKSQIEMRKLKNEKDVLTNQLGSKVYVRFKVKNIGPVKLFREPDIQTLIKDIEEKNKEIVKLGRKIDKSK